VAACNELSEVGERLDESLFWAAADVFEDAARRWFFSGQGRSGLVAAQVAMRFMHIGRASHLVGEATAPAIGRGDGLVVISGSGTTATSLRHAEVAGAMGATVLVVTRAPESELAQLADTVLTVPLVPSGQLGGNLFEQSALIILDSIVTILGSALDDAHGRLRANHANLQ
jgi:6-phospho-3-hexuloisomerase